LDGKDIFKDREHLGKRGKVAHIPVKYFSCLVTQDIDICWDIFTIQKEKKKLQCLKKKNC